MLWAHQHQWPCTDPSDCWSLKYERVMNIDESCSKIRERMLKWTCSGGVTRLDRITDAEFRGVTDIYLDKWRRREYIETVCGRGVGWGNNREIVKKEIRAVRNRWMAGSRKKKWTEVFKGGYWWEYVGEVLVRARIRIPSAWRGIEEKKKKKI